MTICINLIMRSNSKIKFESFPPRDIADEMTKTYLCRINNQRGRKVPKKKPNSAPQKAEMAFLVHLNERNMNPESVRYIFDYKYFGIIVKR